MGIQVVEAEFVCSAFSRSQLPPAQLSEVAFVGRSNVGKSSLLNALCNRRGLAHVSKTPGRTQAINYFRVRCKLPEGMSESDDPFLSFYLVDLPGYGFAKVPKAVKRKWSALLEGYLAERELLHTVVLLLDSRRELEEAEAWVLEFEAAWNTLIALTKADKLSKNQLAAKTRSLQQELEVSKEQIFCTTAPPAKVTGVDRLLAQIVQEILQRPHARF